MSDTPTAVLCFRDLSGEGECLAFFHPAAIVSAASHEEVAPVLDRVAEAAALGRYAVGFVTYDAAPAFDSHLVVRGRAPLPLAWFALFEAATRIDDAALAGMAKECVSISPWEPTEDRDRHGNAIGEIRLGIERGDFYQVNHTFRSRARVAGSDLALFARLCATQRTGYCAYLNVGRHRILSFSPELFFRRAGSHIEMRPMKGTAPRGRWLAEDDTRVARLAASEKDRAENVMIVDLLRNDVGRVATTGSVDASRLFDVERHPTVLQMTSTISASLRRGVTLAHIFGALFPSGSVTGAPKIAAMRCIAHLEDAPRGPYCGAIGMVKPGGDCVFNVAIRTLWLDTDTGEAEYGVGGGITWDSAADAEYEEALLKARVLSEERPRFELLETLRLENGTYVRLERHLRRMTESARYFGFAEARPRALLARLACRWPTGRHRVRLLATADGSVRAERSEMPDDGAATSVDGLADAKPVALARSPVSRHDVFLHHKTTHRVTYDARHDEWPAAWDVLLWNEQREITEFTIGNLVFELDGELWTPPRDCGLLAGTFREELLEHGIVRERVIGIDDLPRASRLWLVNSLREWVAVRLT